MSHMTDAIDFTRDGTPVAAKHYLAHTVEGRSLRELAREAAVIHQRLCAKCAKSNKCATIHWLTQP